MKLNTHNIGSSVIGELVNNELKFTTTDELLDLMGNAYFNGIDTLVLDSVNLPDEFFDLKTKFAGEVLQKFSTYNLRLAIIGDFTNISSNSLKDFIRESNNGNRIFFVGSINELEAKLK